MGESRDSLALEARQVQRDWKEPDAGNKIFAINCISETLLAMDLKHNGDC